MVSVAGFTSHYKMRELALKLKVAHVMTNSSFTAMDMIRYHTI